MRELTATVNSNRQEIARLTGELQRVGAVAERNALLDLRAEQKTALGDRFTLRGYHDTVLGYGCLPVTLVRWGMEA